MNEKAIKIMTSIFLCIFFFGCSQDTVTESLNELVSEPEIIDEPQPKSPDDLPEYLPYADSDMITVSFYPITDWWSINEAPAQPVHEDISWEESFKDEFIRLLDEHTGIKMLDMWFEENRLYVDLDGEILDTPGSTGATAVIVSVYKTLYSLSDAEEIAVLVEGEPEKEGVHIYFPALDKRDDSILQGLLEY